MLTWLIDSIRDNGLLVPALVGFFAAWCTTYLLCPVVHGVALKVRLTDDPDGNRKKQQFPVALGGGVVVYLTLVLLVTSFVSITNLLVPDFGLEWKDVLGFATASTVIVLVGLLDDCFGLRGRHKLIGQIVAASCLMLSGTVVTQVGVLGVEVPLGLLSIPFTMFWLLGAINAINLLDGIDGLATTLGAIVMTTLAAMAALRGFDGVAILGLLVAGSLLGFLRYNWPPARMYLGDAGSMLIGLLAGAMAIRSSLKGTGTLLLAAPLAIWAIPILDSAAAIVRRRLTGRSIFSTDRGHLHHRLLLSLRSNVLVLCFVAGCCLITSAGALASVIYRSDIYSVAACSAVLAMMLVSGLFGRAELQLVWSKVKRLVISLASPRRIQRVAVESRVRLQGSQEWELLWETLLDSAEKLELMRMQLDVNAPALHEGFVATWEHPDVNDARERSWRLELPLAVAELEVGRLLVHGRRNGTSGIEEISRLVDLLEPFEQRLALFTEKNGGGEAEKLAPLRT